MFHRNNKVKDNDQCYFIDNNIHPVALKNVQVFFKLPGKKYALQVETKKLLKLHFS